MPVTTLKSPLPPSMPKNDTLWATYQQQKSQNRMLFPLEGAKQLNVSEFELMLASPHSQYLGKDCKTMLQALTQFSRVESIVRNELAVHEKLGRLQNIELGKRMGIALNVGGLDLRFFIHKWQYMLAVNDISKADAETKTDKKAHSSVDDKQTDKADDHSPGSFSIQFFDEEGRAICKVFLRDYSDAALQQWQDLIQQYAQEVDALETAKAISHLSLSQSDDKQSPSLWQPKLLAANKQEKLHRKWLALTDIHQFHMLLKSLNVDRASSYRQAPEGMAHQLHPDAIEALLLLAKQQAEPIMIFVGNSGMVQIQTGVIHNIKRMGDWINILDKKQTDFTLHLKDKALSQVWCVKRPTKDGIVTCIEGFDEHGVSMITFFGLRQEGEQERGYWREITAELVERYTHKV